MVTKTANFVEILSQKIENRTANVAVIGLGYVGLPLAVEFANAGFNVAGIDLGTTTCRCIIVDLDGPAGLLLSANGGRTTLSGSADIEAEVTLKLAFGVDAKGFYLDAPGVAPTLVVSRRVNTSGR